MLLIALLAGALITAWAALIIQSLAGRGDRAAYFASELDFHCPPDNDDEVILDRDFTFVDSNGIPHTAPRGMHSDGASVGAILCWLFIGWLTRWALNGTPLTGPFRPAAIAHDGMYAAAKDSSFWRALISNERAEADRIIFEAALCSTYRVPFRTATEFQLTRTFERRPAQLWRAFVVLALLRIAGFKAWIDDSKASRSLAVEQS